MLEIAEYGYFQIDKIIECQQFMSHLITFSFPSFK